ncbi:MAG: hypothetical protein LBP98_10070 [Tannerella sp.]|jgi:hypothetical protein|nr:hypothetical protein [Tannerella sp.]
MSRNYGIYGKKTAQSLSGPAVMVLTLLAGLFCWGLEYYFSANYPLHTASSTPLWNRIIGALPDKPSAYLVGMLLLCGMAALLQRANDYLILFRGKTKLPFLLFFLLNSASFGFVPLRPTSVAFFFLALCMVELFKAYREGKTGLAPGNAYKATLWLGIGSLVWIHLLWMLPLFWYGIFRFRLLTLRVFLASLLGVAAIYWMIAGWCVLQHDFSILTDAFRLWTAFDLIPFREYLTTGRLILPTMALAYTVILDLLLRFHTLHAGLRTRRFIAFLLTAARYLLLFLFLFDTETVDFLCIFFFPVSILMAYLFSDTPRNVSLYYYLLLVCSLLLLVVHYV